MKKLFLLILICSNLFCSDLAEDLKNLNYNQRYILVKTFFDSKEFYKSKNDRLLLTAIAWKESNFGEKLVSKTQDYGTFQININSFNSRFGSEIKAAGLSTYTKDLLKNNHRVGMMAAVAELNFWKEKYKTDLDKVVASYNDGTNISNIGKEYSADIRKRMIILDSYLKTAQSNIKLTKNS